MLYKTPVPLARVACGRADTRIPHPSTCHMLLLRTAGRRLATGLRLEPFAAVQCSLRPRTSTAAQTERFDLLSGTAAAASAVASAGGSDAGASAADGAAVDGPVTAADISHLPAETFEQLADVWIGGLWTRLERGLREAEGEVSGWLGRLRAAGLTAVGRHAPQEARALPPARLRPQAFEYDVKPERGSMHVLLPYDGHLIIKCGAQGAPSRHTSCAAAAGSAAAAGRPVPAAATARTKPGHLRPCRKEPQQHCVVIESNLFEPWEDQDAVEFRWVVVRVLAAGAAGGCCQAGASGCWWGWGVLVGAAHAQPGAERYRHRGRPGLGIQRRRELCSRAAPAAGP